MARSPAALRRSPTATPHILQPDRLSTRRKSCLVKPTVRHDSPSMDRYGDPYDRLATLMWLLRPADVAELAALADRLADRRISALLERASDGT